MSVFIGLLVGNFLYQAMFDQLWLVAAERSFFAGFAILVYWAFEGCK